MSHSSFELYTEPTREKKSAGFVKAGSLKAGRHYLMTEEYSKEDGTRVKYSPVMAINKTKVKDKYYGDGTVLELVLGRNYGRSKTVLVGAEQYVDTYFCMILRFNESWAARKMAAAVKTKGFDFECYASVVRIRCSPKTREKVQKWIDATVKKLGIADK